VTWASVGIAACCIATTIALVLTTGEGANPAFAHAFTRVSPFESSGSLISLTTDVARGAHVEISPVVVINALRIPVLVESVTPIIKSGKVELGGEYQMSGCMERPSPFIDGPGESYTRDLPIFPAAPTVFSPGVIPNSKCHSFRYFIDRVIYQKLGPTVIDGFEVVYKADGATYRDGPVGFIFDVGVLKACVGKEQPSKTCAGA
jgi:hypothetical protein